MIDFIINNKISKTDFKTTNGTTPNIKKAILTKTLYTICVREFSSDNKFSFKVTREIQF